MRSLPAAPHLGEILAGCILVLLTDIEEGRRLLELRVRTSVWLNELAARPRFTATAHARDQVSGSLEILGQTAETRGEGWM